jgi:hypothetical protein
LSGPPGRPAIYIGPVKHWIHRKRLLAACGVLAVVAGSLAVWSAASPGAKPSGLETYANGFVTFKYPAAWSPSVFTEQELHFHPMVYLSTQPTHDPCRTAALAGGGNSITCSWPIDRLAAGGVIVVLENRGMPLFSLTNFSGVPTRIGGRRAKVLTQRPGTCRELGGDVTISIAIARPISSNWTALNACLRGPHLAEQERQVRAMLSSMRFLQP